jgi:DNA-binding PadR family transcriptional regulator
MIAPLGEFELLTLLAVLHLGQDAYPPAIRAAIEQRAARAVSRGAIYVTLDRLEAKRLLASTPDRSAEGGRLRHIYRVTPRGRQALRRALAAVENMRAGLEPLLDEP